MAEYHGASGHVFYQRRPFRRWALLLATALILALLLGYTRWLNALPNVVIPGHPLVAHNAYNDYVRAVKLLKDKAEIADAVGPNPTLPSPRREALLGENQPALRALKRGLAKEYTDRAVRSFTARIAYLPGYRNLTRLLDIEGWAKASHGNWNGMVSDDLGIVRFGLQIPRGGTLISMLVGQAVESIGVGDIERALPHLSAPDALATAKKLESMGAQRQPMSATIREEKWSTEASLIEAFRKPAWRWQSATTLLPTDDDSSRYSLGIRLMRYSDREIFANFDRYMNQCIANSELPYGTVEPRIPIPSDPIGQILTPLFSQAEFFICRQESREAMLVTALALHAYRLEQRAYPADLSALTESGAHGGYLDHLPADPFAPDGKLRYRLMGKSYLLYSVGPDRIDDSGVPIENESEPGGHVSHVVLPNSRGDIVFGAAR